MMQTNFVSKITLNLNRRIDLDLINCHMFLKIMNIGGSKGAPGTRAPLGSKFFHFHAVFGKILNNNNSNFGSWRTLLGKILDPPLMKMFVETFFIFVTFSSNLGKNRVKKLFKRREQPTPFPNHIFRERNFWFISRSN